MSTEEIKADINIRPDELEAIKKAQVIRLTDGTEYVRKDVAEKVMEEYAGKELASLKEENALLMECFELSEQAKNHLRSKGYGWTGLDILKTCELVEPFSDNK